MSTLSVTETQFIGPQDNGLLMTPAEFDAVADYDESYRYELINGVLVVNPIPDHAERDPNEELGHRLRTYQEQHPGILDKTLFEEYVQTADSRRRADRVMWIGLGRTPDPKSAIPTIVVEFVSKRRRDRLRDYVHKRDEYLAAGVVEYWVIDRFQRTMTVFRKGNGQTDQLSVTENETYTTSLLPGFELSLASLFRVADEWSDT